MDELLPWSHSVEIGVRNVKGVASYSLLLSSRFEVSTRRPRRVKTATLIKLCSRFVFCVATARLDKEHERETNPSTTRQRDADRKAGALFRSMNKDSKTWSNDLGISASRIVIWVSSFSSRQWSRRDLIRRDICTPARSVLQWPWKWVFPAPGLS